jgi:[ribosomal protein S5]-alanine N-acetyltransferase
MPFAPRKEQRCGVFLLIAGMYNGPENHLEESMSGKLVLETMRLLVREFDEEDVEPFFRLGSDPSVTRYTGGTLRDRDHALEILRSNPLADYRNHGYGRWACVLKDNGEIIGFAGLKHLEDLREVDLGYRFLPAYWGAGLGTEAARAVLGYGLSHLGLKQIVALVHLENVASMRVLEKIGMEPTGTIEYRGDAVARYVAPRNA